MLIVTDPSLTFNGSDLPLLYFVSKSEFGYSLMFIYIYILWGEV